LPFPSLEGNEYSILAICLAYFIRKEDKVEAEVKMNRIALLRKEDKAEMALLRKEDKAEMALLRKEDKLEMRLTSLFNFLVALLAAYSSFVYTTYTISK